MLGFAGLVGAGRSEIAQALFGLDPDATGAMSRARAAAFACDRRVRRCALGIGLVPEDRKRQGLVLSMSAARQHDACRSSTGCRALGFIRERAERALARGYVRAAARPHRADLDAPAAGLSGGNQQKIVLAKWLAARCRILILDEPTRGVDVGAKAEIHALIDELAAGGAGVLLISSELPEILHLSTRILVLRQGRIVGELPRAQASQDALMRMMAGVT